MIHGILFSLYGNCRDKIRALEQSQKDHREHGEIFVGNKGTKEKFLREHYHALSIATLKNHR
jgi:hypothetical protein